jgi:hypothetical protein
MVKTRSLNHSQTIYKRNIMTIQNAPGFAPKSNSDKGFSPNTENKAKRQQVETTAPTADLVAAKQSGSMQARETALATAGNGARALQVLAEQREQVKDTLKNEIIRLTDPDLFFAELMSEVAAELPKNEAQLDFFGCYSTEELLLPEIKSPIALAAATVEGN